MLNLSKKPPTYDEIGNLIYPKSNKLKYILITIVSIICIASISLTVYNVFIKNRDVKDCIMLNAKHVENKDLEGYMSDLSSKLPKNLRDNIKKVMKNSFKADKSKIKISIKQIHVIKRDADNAIVEVIMTNGKTEYKARHLLLKEDGRFKFFRTYIYSK